MQIDTEANYGTEIILRPYDKTIGITLPDGKRLVIEPSDSSWVLWADDNENEVLAQGIRRSIDVLI